MATCYRHPNRETGVSCSNCGRAICTDCMTPISVGMRCPECAKQRTQVRTASSLQRDPTVTYVLIAINVIVFIAASVGGGGLAGGVHGKLLNNLALDADKIKHGQEYWRLITSGFMHASLLHIGFNMYILYFMGRMLEPSIGRIRFLAIYFTALLTGAFGALLVTPHSLTIGASGAIFGLFGGAFVAMRARGFDPMQSGLGALILINLALSFVLSGISIGGHIGGLIGGAAAGYVLVDVGDRLSSPAIPLLACLGISAVAVAASIVASSSLVA
ncbi:MAG TPA: rhomboid family intramembrane serine protease [Solirubrobacteraceae bacterium]|nr:rhomboid family intramembrane serine protease [Solirubrobacteraceae bacterium]